MPKGWYLTYVLLEDLERSEDENSWFDGFYEVLTPATYAKRLEKEMKFGPPKPQKDCEGYDITPHSVADYTYHCWPDYDSLEWETHCIRQFIVYCILKIPIIAEGNPKSCMRIFPIIADAFGISLRPQ